MDASDRDSSKDGCDLSGDLSKQFGNPVLVHSMSAGRVTLSPDELALYFSTSTTPHELQVAHRSSTADVFGTGTGIANARFGDSPSITSDAWHEMHVRSRTFLQLVGAWLLLADFVHHPPCDQ